MVVYDIQGVTKCYPGQVHPANRGISLQIQQGALVPACQCTERVSSAVDEAPE